MKAQGGFTLIEIMVVLLIIAGLAYIVGTNVIGQLDKSKIENTKIQITQLESGLKLFKVDNGFYPIVDVKLNIGRSTAKTINAITAPIITIITGSSREVRVETIVSTC